MDEGENVKPLTLILVVLLLAGSVNAINSTCYFRGECELPEYNISDININRTEQTPCFHDLLNGSLKEAYKCLYIGRNFHRDDGVMTMGYFFYLIVFVGIDFMFYLKHKNIAISGMIMLILLGVFNGEFPTEAAIIYWLTVVAAVVVTLYGLFKNDDY